MKVTTLSRNFYYMKLFWSFTTPKVKLRNRLDQGGGVQLIGYVKTLQADMEYSSRCGLWNGLDNFLNLFHSFSSGAFISEAGVVLKACFSFRDENFLSCRREGWPWAITVFIVVD